VVRLNLEGLDDVKDSTHVMAINLILSEKKFSPKLLAVFSEGTISQYIDARYFDYKDDIDKNKAGKLARILANFHSLKMPIPKDKMIMSLFKRDNPFMNMIHKVYKDVVHPEIQKQNYQVLNRINYISEMDWLREIIEDLKSPPVFSHNDFNKKNILVNERENSEEVQIFLIDFDWTTYNLRGIDLGQYFSSWGQIEPDFGSGEFPTDEQMYVFIDSYIDEMCKIFGDSYSKQEINSRQQLIKEAKIFALISFMKDLMYFIWQFSQNNNVLDKAEIRVKCYEDLKNRILAEYKL